MAADTERMEKLATTCVENHKKRYLFNDLKKMKSLSAVRYVRYCPMFPIHFKEVKNLEFKDKFLSLDFHHPSGDSAAHSC